MTISLIVVQEMCMRNGIVTGQGLADLIREQFGVRWTAFVMLALLIANGGVIVSEFVGIGQGSELLGVSPLYCDPSLGNGDLVARSQRLAETRGASIFVDVAACFSAMSSPLS